MNTSYLIGIAGGSGSGKTTFLRALFDAFAPGELALVSQDNYYHPIEQQQKDDNGWHNFDLPESIDRGHFFEDITALQSGNSIEKLEYTFNNDAARPERILIEPAPVLITEGLFVFHYDEINTMLDYRVYFDADRNERLRRRIYRDDKERGYPEHEVRYQWENHVIPAEEKFLLPHKQQADLVIDNTKTFERDLDRLVSHIQSILS